MGQKGSYADAHQSLHFQHNVFQHFLQDDDAPQLILQLILNYIVQSETATKGIATASLNQQ